MLPKTSASIVYREPTKHFRFDSISSESARARGRKKQQSSVNKPSRFVEINSRLGDLNGQFKSIDRGNIRWNRVENF